MQQLTSAKLMDKVGVEREWGFCNKAISGGGGVTER
jgi:hypothetical protein